MFRDLMEASRGIDAHGIDDAEWQAHIAEREQELRSGRTASRELERSDGRAMICNMAPLSGGKVLVSYVDVTEMKDREAELADALEKSKLAEAVIDGVRDPVFVKDSELSFVIANQRFLRACSASTPQAMVGRQRSRFRFAGREAARFEAAERQVLRHGEALRSSRRIRVLRRRPGRRIVRKNRVSTSSGKDYVAGFLFDVTEMKRREIEADEARRQLADVLERMPAGVVIYDRDDNFVFANRKLQESLPALKSVWQPGRTLRDAFDRGHSVGYFRSSGDSQVDELYDVDKERWIEGILARYHLRHFEFERRNPDGRWYQVYDMRTDDGTFIGVRVDITELKRREKALRDSMRQIDLFRHVLDELPVAAFIKSDDLRIEYVNKAWTSISGISKEEAVGHTDLELFGGDEAEGYTASDTEVSATGKVVETEEPVTHRDGTVRQLMTRKSRLVAMDGSVHLVGSSTDITDVKERENQLNESLRENEVFRSLIDNVPVAIYAKRPDLRLFYVNKGWSDLTGFTAG